MQLENTLQQRDPVGTSAFVRLVGVGGAAIALLVAVLITELESNQIDNWAFEIAAIAVVALCGALHVWGSSPFRAPYRRSTHVVVLLLLCIAFSLDEVAQLGRNTVVHDDWGLAVISIYLYMFAGVRPPIEVLIGGLATSLVVGGVVVAVSPYVAVHVSPFARATVAIASTLPSVAGAAAFGYVTLRALGRAAERTRAVDPEPSDVALSVQQEGIARLEAEVVPLLRDVVADDLLTREDGVLARRLATELRAKLVADLDRGWLEELGFEVSDTDGYAERMLPEQRTAIRSILSALPLLRPEQPGSAQLSGQDYDAVIQLHIDLKHKPSRVHMAPRVLLLRTVFPQASYRVDDGVVIVAEFSIDQVGAAT